MLSIKKRPLGKEWLEYYENQWITAEEPRVIDLSATIYSSDPYIQANLGL